MMKFKYSLKIPTKQGKEAETALLGTAARTNQSKERLISRKSDAKKRPKGRSPEAFHG